MVNFGGHLDRFIIAIASVGYIGYSPWVPGTVGTLAGVFVFLAYSPFPPAIYVLNTVAFFALAVWASHRAEIILGQRDSPRIVIDEIVGYLITMAFLPRNLTYLAGGFLFFRVLDIIKPFPAGTINDRLRGGLGVVLDDVVAGIYANLLLRVAVSWRPDLGFILDRWLCR